MNQHTRRYALLSALQAFTGASIATVTSVLYFASPNALHSASLTIVMAGCGAAVTAYYLSVHQWLKKTNLKLSSIILSALTALNIIILVTATGGLDSPYYAVWLLAIIAAGFFGQTATLVILGVTVAYFGYDMLHHGLTKSYLLAHAPEYVLTVITAVMAEWIHVNLGRGNDSVTQLSGQLSQEAFKTEALIRSVSEGVMVINSQCQIQLFNPAAVKMTGWDAQSAQDMDCNSVLNLRDAAGNKLADSDNPFETLRASGKSVVRNDLMMETKNGKKASVSLSLSPIYDNTKAIVGSIALFRDISSEKEVERQRNEFISTASHEMRTPVAAIEGYLSLAMNSSVATIDDRAKSYLNKAHSSTQHLGELFRDLLSITKMEDNRAGAEEVFNLTTVVKEAVGDMKFEADKKGLELYFDVSQDDVRRETTVLPIYAVKANPQRLREVVMNLIENALKFTTEGHIQVSVTGATDAVTVSVTDTGIGIAQEDISHLFQKLYRIDNTATRTIGGTGLGLFLCRSIIEHLGGRIWVESKPGFGSSFKFSLPRQASETIAPAVVPAAPGPAAVATQSVAAPQPQPALVTAAAPVGINGKMMTDVRQPAGVK